MKKDQSKKGSLDVDIQPLLDSLNAQGVYTTTSSCSGRIVLLDVPTIGDKKNARWVYVTHEEADAEKIADLVQHAPSALWLLQESMIVHVRCTTLNDADRLLQLAQRCGLKRSGIFSLKRFSVEIQGTERIETIVTPGIPKEYILRLVHEANAKLRRTKQNMRAFHDQLELRS